jgi:hypothetical protein
LAQRRFAVLLQAQPHWSQRALSFTIFETHHQEILRSSIAHHWLDPTIKYLA